MTSISIRLEDHLEGTPNFNTWRERVLNILEEHDLDSFVTYVIEDATTNEGRSNYKKNQENSKRSIFESVKDNLMSVITPLKMKNECFVTFVGLIFLLVLTRGSTTTKYQQNTKRHHPNRGSSLSNTHEVGVVSPNIS